MKVFRRTRVVRGTPARIRAWGLLALTLVFPVMAGWGYFQARHLAATAEAYAANPAVQSRCAAGAAAVSN